MGITSNQRFQREVTNYFAGLRYVEKHAMVKQVRHDHLFELHRLLAGEVMDQGQAGAYRTIGVRVGKHLPPTAAEVSPLMFEDRPAYYAALDEVRLSREDLSRWLEYSAAGLRHTLDRVWLRVRRFQSASPEKIILTPKQEHLLGLLRDHGSLAPVEIRSLLEVSKQGAMNILNPLLEAGMIEKRGTHKSGRYFLS